MASIKESFAHRDVEECSPAANTSRFVRRSLSISSSAVDRGNKGYLDDTEKLVRKYDSNNDGKFDISEVFKIVEDLEENRRKRRCLGKGLVAAIGVALLLLLCVFGLMWAVVVLSKEVSADNGVLVDHKTGQELATHAAGNAIDIELAASIADKSSRRRSLQEGCDGQDFFGKSKSSTFENSWNNVLNGDSSYFSYTINSIKYNVGLDMTTATSTAIDSKVTRYTGLKDLTMTDPQVYYHAYCGLDTDPDKCLFYSTTAPSVVVSTVDMTSATFAVRSDFPGTIVVEYATDKLFSGSQTSGSSTTSASNDCTGYVTVTGLEPAQTYYYRVLVEGAPMESTYSRSFKTYPKAEDVTDLNSFSFVVFADSASAKADNSDETYQSGGKENALFALQIGDFDHSDPTTLDDYRQMHRLLRSAKFDQGQLLSENVLSKMSFWHTWDDHDFCGNDSGKDCPTAQKDAALQAFNEYYPNYPYANEGDGIYYSFSVGNAQIFMLDSRSQRTNNAHEDNAYKTMLGDAQKQWLKRELLSSSAKWKFVISTVTANTSARPTHLDHWNGFQTEANEMRLWLEDNKLNDGSVIMISADLHTGGALDNGCNNRFDLPEMSVATTNLAGGNVDHVGSWSKDAFPGAPGYSVVKVSDTSVSLILKDKEGNRLSSLDIAEGFDNGCSPAKFDDGKRCSYSYQAFSTGSEGKCANEMRRNNMYTPPFPVSTVNGVTDYVRHDMKFYKCDDDGTFVIESNNIPNHDAERFRYPMCEKFMSYVIPQDATYVAERRVEIGNIIGVSMDGVVALHGRESDGGSAVEGAVKVGAQAWFGHANQRNLWHYHSPAMGVKYEGGEPWDSSVLLGIAMDGFPIYGPLSDEDAAVRLDDCNFDKDTYRYHVRTVEQVDETLPYCKGNFEAATNWNYIAGCFRGDLSKSSVEDGATWSKASTCYQTDIDSILAAAFRNLP